MIHRPLDRLRLRGLICPCFERPIERDARIAMSSLQRCPVSIWWHRKVKVKGHADVDCTHFTPPSLDLASSDDSSVYSSPRPLNSAGRPTPPPRKAPGTSNGAVPAPSATPTDRKRGRQHEYVPFAATLTVVDDRGGSGRGPSVIVRSDEIYRRQYDFVGEDMGKGIVDATAILDDAAGTERAERIIPLAAIDVVSPGGDAWDVLTGSGVDPNGGGCGDSGDAGCRCEAKVHGWGWRRLLRFDVLPSTEMASGDRSSVEDRDTAKVIEMLNSLVAWDRLRRSSVVYKLWGRICGDKAGVVGSAEDAAEGGFVMMGDLRNV